MAMRTAQEGSMVPALNGISAFTPFFYARTSLLTSSSVGIAIVLPSLMLLSVSCKVPAAAAANISFENTFLIFLTRCQCILQHMLLLSALLLLNTSGVLSLRASELASMLKVLIQASLTVAVSASSFYLNKEYDACVLTLVRDHCLE